MGKRRHKISSEIRARILAEILKPGSNIPKIAKTYSISDGTIYRFRREAQKLTKNISTNEPRALSSEKAATTRGAGKFIELSICDSQNAELSEGVNTATFIMSTSASTVSPTSNMRLQKASFIFDDFSVVLEGKINTSRILRILKVLSASEEEYPC
jgi:transposase-like protein